MIPTFINLKGKTYKFTFSVIKVDKYKTDNQK